MDLAGYIEQYICICIYIFFFTQKHLKKKRGHEFERQ